MNIIALLLFILMSIINMIACNKKINILIALSKITLAPLAYINVIINTNFSTKILFLISLCYAFYLIGDILLLSEKTNYFVSGLISFLLGHLSFIIIFFNFKENILIFFVFLILLIYPEILMFKITKNGKNLKKPMQIYSILLALFIALSATTLNPFFIIGTSLFTLSDSFIARNVCYGEKKFSSTAVMSTYTLALILLSIGLVYLY
jgi:uncharacterized membrane protein YhhN